MNRVILYYTFSPLTSEQRATENAIVAFELKDKDFLRSRFMAEAFLPFSEIPETGPDRGIESLEQIHLKLSRPIRKSKFYIFNSIFLYCFFLIFFFSRWFFLRRYRHNPSVGTQKGRQSSDRVLIETQL